ncbi:MAG: glycosyltransferase family 9 protein [Planctomycetaceae bacterium]|nr:glycosyltransferase family 9 protein [Planctomycetaceae bacterium]
MPSWSERRLPIPPRASTRYRYTRRRWHVLFAIIDAVGAWLFALGRYLFGSRQLVPLDEVRSILLMQLDHLGDALFTTAMLPALRERFPHARLEVLAAPWNQAVFAAHEVDAIHVWATNRFQRGGNWRWPIELVAWAWKLRQKRFDLAIDVRGELPQAALIWLAGCRRRVGWSDGGGAFLLTDVLQHQPGVHELDARRELLRILDVSPNILGQIRPRWPINDRDRRAVQTTIDSPDDGAGPLVVVHVGAGTLAKRWTLAHLQELLGRLIVELNARVVLVGSADERAWADQITQGRVWPQVVDRVGQLTLGELAALCERAAVFVGADSGPAHLAAAVACPVVALFSGTNHVAQWRPVGSLVRVLKHEVACSPCHRQACPWADHPCMTGIRPEQVLAAVRELIVEPAVLEEPRAIPIRLAPLVSLGER